MFDNAIFASFIPQILMVIAYISCVIAPKTNNNESVENVSVGVVIQYTQHQSTATCVITDELYSVTKYSKTIVYSAIDEIHWYPKSIQYSSFNEPEFRFSRPPPIYC